MLPTLAPLILTATVAVHVEHASGLEPAEVQRLASTLAEALGRRTGTAATVVDGRLECEGERACFAAVVAASGRDDVLVVDAVALPSRVRLSARRLRGSADARSESALDLPRDGEGWPTALDGLVGVLYPEVPLPTLRLEPPPPQIVTVTEPVQAVPWVLVGGGAAVASIGLGVGLLSARFRRQVETEVHTQDDYAELTTRTKSFALAANVLFAVATVSIGTGVGLWVFD